MRGPLGQDEAMPSSNKRGDDVGNHLLVAGVVGNQLAVDGRDPAGSRHVGVPPVGEGS
ncbi:MAG: hypothetical protein M3Z25_19365 [Actinomycetota bacterium]|nr:hypothetical protein [Actinomycetota bacterium]